MTILKLDSLPIINSCSDLPLQIQSTSSTVKPNAPSPPQSPPHTKLRSATTTSISSSSSMSASTTHPQGMSIYSNAITSHITAPVIHHFIPMPTPMHITFNEQNSNKKNSNLNDLPENNYSNNSNNYNNNNRNSPVALSPSSSSSTSSSSYTSMPMPMPIPQHITLSSFSNNNLNQNRSSSSSLLLKAVNNNNNTRNNNTKKYFERPVSFINIKNSESKDSSKEKNTNHLYDIENYYNNSSISDGKI
jgi:hypothetical protein